MKDKNLEKIWKNIQTKRHFRSNFPTHVVILDDNLSKDKFHLSTILILKIQNMSFRECHRQVETSWKCADASFKINKPNYCVSYKTFINGKSSNTIIIVFLLVKERDTLFIFAANFIVFLNVIANSKSMSISLSNVKNNEGVHIFIMIKYWMNLQDENYSVGIE